ncbi:hypothetical protein HY772_08315 [Candidatus Woesearchaeota archaeon]|nr:hypothetical protein [Candidatus Woesearchaeota archaeon]
MKNRTWLTIIGMVLFATYVMTFNYGGCGGGGGSSGGSSSGSSAPAIAAPSNLTATTPDSYGLFTLSWQDNSNNEIMFRIEIKRPGSGWMPFDEVVGGTISTLGMVFAKGETDYFRHAIADDYITQSGYSNELAVTWN